MQSLSCEAFPAKYKDEIHEFGLDEKGREGLGKLPNVVTVAHSNEIGISREISLSSRSDVAWPGKNRVWRFRADAGGS